jgi:phosphatidylglycerophosphatase A
MSKHNKQRDHSVKLQSENSGIETKADKTTLDYFSLAITTFGVGYIPLAPGTWGSGVGVLIYLVFRKIEYYSVGYLTIQNWQSAQVSAWISAVNALLLLLFCLLGIWAADRASRIFGEEDPQRAIVDEIIGQLITFLFVPFIISWQLVLVGFLLFRLFDIWKPYPIDSLQNLHGGLGVCADDILAGVYAGICLAIIYAVSLSI